LEGLAAHQGAHRVAHHGVALLEARQRLRRLGRRRLRLGRFGLRFLGGRRRPRAPGSGKRPTRGIQYGLPGNKAAPRGSTIAPYATSGLDLERYPQDTPEARFLPPPWYAEQKAAPAAEQKASRATEQKALSVRPGAAPNSAS